MFRSEFTPTEIAILLADRIDDLALFLYGPPKTKSPLEWRYGATGKLSIAVGGDKKGKFFDFKANEGGDALRLVQRARGGSVLDAMLWSIAWLGGNPVTDAGRRHAKLSAPTGRHVDRQRNLREHGLKLYREAQPPDGTVVEAYLRGRGVWPGGGITDVKYHPRCCMGERHVPCMVALFRNIITNEPVSIHRTALLPDGSDRDRVIGKRMLGPRTGAAIKLCPDDAVSLGLGITEGVETALSMLARGWGPVWATGDAGAVESFPVLEGVEHLTIFADNDESARGQRAARACAANWVNAGRRVTIYTPSTPDSDWNDCVRGTPHDT